MPLWFNAAMEHILADALAPVIEHILADALAPIRADLEVLKDDMRFVKRVQCQVWKLAAKVSNVFPSIPPLLMIYSKNHNLAAGMGEDAKLEVVPFSNGQDPTKDPVGFFLPFSHICYELIHFASTIFQL